MNGMRVLFFLLVGLLGVNWAFAGFFRALGKLNNHKDPSPGNDVAEKEMVEAADWLRQREGNGDDALKQFLELKSVLSLKKCDKSGAETLNANDRLVKALASDPSVDKSMAQKIEAIVKLYQENFSVICYSSCSKLVAKKMKRISRSSRKYVLQLAGPGVAGIGALRELVRQDPERDVIGGLEYEFQRQRVTHNDYIHYMVGPCEELNNEVTKDYFDVIELIVLIRGRNPMQAREKEFKGLSQNLSAMRACRSIVENKDQNWQRMEELMAKEEKSEIARVKERDELLAEEERKNPHKPHDFGSFGHGSYLSEEEQENIRKHPVRASLLAFIKAFNDEAHGK